MNTTVRVEEETRMKLNLIKVYEKTRNADETINLLIKKYFEEKDVKK